MVRRAPEVAALADRDDVIDALGRADAPCLEAATVGWVMGAVRLFPADRMGGSESAAVGGPAGVVAPFERGASLLVGLACVGRTAAADDEGWASWMRAGPHLLRSRCRGGARLSRCGG